MVPPLAADMAALTLGVEVHSMKFERLKHESTDKEIGRRLCSLNCEQELFARYFAMVVKK